MQGNALRRRNLLSPRVRPLQGPILTAWLGECAAHPPSNGPIVLRGKGEQDPLQMHPQAQKVDLFSK